MTEARTRRPLPALICLLALTLLTALVWWRVLTRDSGTAASTKCPTSTVTPLPQPASVSLLVFNGTQRNGLAKTTAAALQKLGFAINGYQNDTKPVTGVAEIRFSPDDSQQATLLSYYVPGAKLVPLDATTSNRLILSLGAQYKSLATPAQVSSAMASAHVTLAPKNGVPAPSATC